MPETTYPYAVPAAFAGLDISVTEPNLSKLKDEIEAASLSTALSRIDMAASLCSVVMAGALSGADATSLNAVITAHDGVPMPGPVAGTAGVLQTKSAKVTTDKTTTSLVFTELMSLPITTSAGTALMIQFAANFTQSQNNGVIATEIEVDGAQAAAGEVTHGGSGTGGSHSLVARVTGLAAGAHMVKVNWKVQASTGRCRPVTEVDKEGAAVLVWETSV
jgi:hypothetical protein